MDDVDELDVAELLTDLTGVVRASYIMAHLKKFIDIIDEADSIYANFPKVLKEQLGCDNCGHDVNLNARAKGKLALAFAQVGPDVRGAVKVMLEETQQYVGVWMPGSDDTPDGSLYGMMDDNDIAVIEEMVAFVQKVGSRSTRHLLNFLRAINDDEHAFMLIKGAGRQSEVRMRHGVNDQTLSDFELK